jgi:hypothetical protein
MVSTLTRRTWLLASAICGTPTLLVPLLMMLALWGSAAEVYSVAIQAPHPGAYAAGMMVAVNLTFSGWLFVNFLKLSHDLREWRIPGYRRLLGAALTFILGFTVVAPCGFALSLDGGTYDALAVGLGACAGMVAALLWRMQSEAVGAHHARWPAETIPRGKVARASTVWQALRTALGSPYAPVSWRRRALQLALLCCVLAGAPALVIVFGTSLGSRAFSTLLKVSEIAGLLGALVLCWIWPLSRAVALFNPKRGALTELAFLPGLGDGTQLRRRLYLAVMSFPAGSLTALLIIAESAAWIEQMPGDVYGKLALEFALIPLITAPALLGLMAQGRAMSGWSFAPLLISQVVGLTPLIWMSSSQVLLSAPFLWLGIAIVVFLLILTIGTSMYLLRKIAKRPHPFAEISE